MGKKKSSPTSCSLFSLYSLRLFSIKLTSGFSLFTNELLLSGVHIVIHYFIFSIIHLFPSPEAKHNGYDFHREYYRVDDSPSVHQHHRQTHVFGQDKHYDTGDCHHKRYDQPYKAAFIIHPSSVFFFFEHLPALGFILLALV